jgi:hypothetical protein
MTSGEMAHWDNRLSSYLIYIELLHIFNMPLDILVEPLNTGAKCSNLRSSIYWPRALHDFASPRKLHGDVMCLLLFPLELQSDFEAQTRETVLSVVLRPKLSRETYPLCLLHDLDVCHRRPRPPDHQVILRLRLTWSTWSTPRLLPMWSCLLMSPSVSHHGQPSCYLGPRFKLHVCPSHLHHALRPSLCSTLAHQHRQETCCAHTHVIVNIQTQPKLIISISHSSQTRHTRTHIYLVFAWI